MNHSSRSPWKIILVIILLLIFIFLLFRCCHRCHRPPYSRQARASDNQMIIWKDPDSSAMAFQSWLNKFKDTVRQYGEITDSTFCPTCDSTLTRISGPGPLIYMQQQLSGGSGGTPTGGVGHNGPAYYCTNLAIHAPEQSRLAIDGRFYDSIYYTVEPGKAIGYSLSNLSSYPRPEAPSAVTSMTAPGGPAPAPGAITVAVFDTGIDSTLRSKYVLGNTQSCNPDARSSHGWNFISDNANTLDDDSAQHGSNVTMFILDQVTQYNPGSVNILPVKVLDNKGAGTLYGLLCGIAYAANSGAKVFNASLGFYYYTDSVAASVAVPLLSKYLQHYLRPNGIVLVAAAGNQDSAEDARYNALKGYATANPRNLDSNYFYPASFATTADPNFNNVFAVTTVSLDSDKVSPQQNFSANAVDFGVNCDWILNDTLANGTILPEYVFARPLFGTKIGDSIPTVTGSSYAAPIITGRIAAEYAQLFKGGGVDKKVAIGLMPGIVSTGKWLNLPAIAGVGNPMIPIASPIAGSSFKTTIKHELVADGYHFVYKNK
jgi:Subtilase family